MLDKIAGMEHYVIILKIWKNELKYSRAYMIINFLRFQAKYLYKNDSNIENFQIGT